ncbi:ABC transporter ATP-binding protein [Pseudogemmobacter faecipullorum]|uniref:Spermidine/putrescine import ATP-binding protein PotA n=1 Tax=Pseudogemmobacter faecipullorum TaxID=2755041 RepID=A0ABS8CM04_9RHOB|nr:ABC transporter ATP-binding protein [Pseudogemmobacter faecipullorum]MCB5410412.1 ABC transporter ATP-binding protein [Pseudogemmobacter faecipullorum]
MRHLSGCREGRTDVQDRFIAFESVRKSYDGINYVVRGLDLDIAEGEFLTLLGPSGSGKTTTLMMLAGFETPTSGSILLGGQHIEKVPAYDRNIGMVFQNYALFPHMTVGENVAFPLKMRRMNRSEVTQRVRKALDMVRMSGFEGRKPAQLSGGQQQRIALARALVFEPRLILMDEPLGALDKQLREHMQLEIKHLHDRLGINIVYVTHDQSEALTMSDRVGVFSDGILQQVAPPDRLYEMPDNLFVAGFVGENNTFSGEIVALDGESCVLRCADGATIRAGCGKGLVMGGKAAVVVRPERMLPGSAGSGLENQFGARLDEVIYHGDHLRLRISLLGSEGIQIKVPAGSLDAPLTAGSNVSIGWRADHCRALPQA